MFLCGCKSRYVELIKTVNCPELEKALACISVELKIFLVTQRVNGAALTSRKAWAKAGTTLGAPYADSAYKVLTDSFI